MSKSERKILIAPSILSADFSMLGRDIKKIESSGADMVHIDVMDGLFVPNITIGPLVVKAIRGLTGLVLDVHLMVEAPHRFIEDFVKAGSDIITVHAEAYGKNQKQKMQNLKKGVSKSVREIDKKSLIEVFKKIKSFGKKAGISLNPDTPFCIEPVLSYVDLVLIMSVHPGFGGQRFIPDVLPKIKIARALYDGDIEVDGGINDKNVKMVIDAGANVIVAGSYFFNARDPVNAVKKLKIFGY